MTIDCEAFWVRTIIAQPLGGILVFSFFQKLKKKSVECSNKRRFVVLFFSNQSGKFMFLHNRRHNLLKR